MRFRPLISPHTVLLAPATHLSKNSLHLSHLLLGNSATLSCVIHRAVPGRKEHLAAMYPHQFRHERESVDEQHAPERDQGISHRRLPQRSRVCVLLVLALFGLSLLATGAGAGKGATLSQQYASPGPASVQAVRAPQPGARPTPGLGAGAASGEKIGAHTPAALCLNPLDVTCWLQSAAQWVAQQLMNALQPVIGPILNSPLNIPTHTPPPAPYPHPTP